METMELSRFIPVRDLGERSISSIQYVLGLLWGRQSIQEGIIGRSVNQYPDQSLDGGEISLIDCSVEKDQQVSLCFTSREQSY